MFVRQITLKPTSVSQVNMVKGQIQDFSFQTNSGAIAGDDGNQYSFAGAQWQASEFPEAGMRVDFEPNGSIATNISIDATAPDPGPDQGTAVSQVTQSVSSTADALRPRFNAAAAKGRSWFTVAGPAAIGYAMAVVGILKSIPIKWLIAGGAGVGVVVVAIIALSVLSAVGVIGGGNPQPASALDLTPDDAITVVHLDVQKILEEDDIAEEMDVDDVVDLDSVGILPGEVSEIVISDDGDRGSITVLKGDFNLDDIREEWEDDGAEKDAYRGYEIWSNMSNGGIAAPLNGYLLMSESERAVEKALKNLYNGTGSLEKADGDNAMKQILDRLGRGYAAYAAGSRSCQVNSCAAYGYVMTDYEPEDEEAKIEIALLFHNERAAERAADDYDDVADFLELSDNLDIEDTEANGEFVTGIAYREIE